MKRHIIEEEYIRIVAGSVNYDPRSASCSEPIYYLDEPFDATKDYSVELEKAKAKFNRDKPWNSTPKIVRYWKTISVTLLEE